MNIYVPVILLKIFNWGEPHINGTAMRELYIIITSVMQGLFGASLS